MLFLASVAFSHQILLLRASLLTSKAGELFKD